MPSNRSYHPAVMQIRAHALAASLALLLVPTIAAGQSSGEAPDAFASREGLEAEIGRLEAAGGAAGHVTLLRRRLTEGDFRAGDQIAVIVEGEPELSDTFTVRTGQRELASARFIASHGLPSLTVEAINRAENVRGQLAALVVRLGGKGSKEASHPDVIEAAEALDAKVVAVEETLFQMRVTGRGQDMLRWPMKTAEQLLYLLGRHIPHA